MVVSPVRAQLAPVALTLSITKSPTLPSMTTVALVAAWLPELRTCTGMTAGVFVSMGRLLPNGSVSVSAYISAGDRQRPRAAAITGAIEARLQAENS